MRTLLFGILLSSISFGELKRLHFDERVDLNQGKDYGNAGPYERILANGAYGDAPAFHVEVLKPRDPARGNGSLIYLAGKGPSDLGLMEAGFTIVRMREGDPAALRELVSFLRYGGTPFVLGDQKRFLKRFIAYSGAADVAKLQQYAQSGNVDEKNRKVFDLLWLHEAKAIIEPQNGLQVRISNGKAIDAIAIETDNSLKSK